MPPGLPIESLPPVGAVGVTRAHGMPEERVKVRAVGASVEVTSAAAVNREVAARDPFGSCSSGGVTVERSFGRRAPRGTLG